MQHTLLIFSLSFGWAAQAEIIKSDSLISPPPVKSEIIAYGFAAAGTILPSLAGAPLAANWNNGNHEEIGTALILTGFTIGPSLGQFYAESFWQGSLALLGRGIGAGLIAYGFSKSLDEAPGNGPSAADLTGTIGLILEGSGTIYSLIDTHFAVKRANDKIQAQHFGFSPELFPSSNGGLKPGVVAWVKF